METQNRGEGGCRHPILRFDDHTWRTPLGQTEDPGHDSGEPYHDLQIPWKRWVFAHKKLSIRYREPYQMRHTSVTWNLMVGMNLLLVAQNHGHSPAVM